MKTDSSPPRAARPRAADWLATLVFAPLFLLILLVFEPVQRVARLFGRRPHDYAAGALQWSILLALRVCGTRLTVERPASVKPHTAYIIVGNHQSMFDIVALGALLFTNFPKYVSKRELARGIPSVSYNIRAGGSAIIDRRDREQALPEIRRLGRTVHERGVSAVIFPEGTRAKDGVMKAFRPGGTLALLEAAPDAPLLPVAIDGSWRLMMFGLRPMPFGVRLRIRMGDPLPRDRDAPELLDDAERWIAGTVASWRVPASSPIE
jgi:1-acyl-sn-glycerol-3-phosphate acyltransferase